MRHIGAPVRSSTDVSLFALWRYHLAASVGRGVTQAQLSQFAECRTIAVYGVLETHSIHQEHAELYAREAVLHALAVLLLG